MQPHPPLDDAPPRKGRGDRRRDDVAHLLLVSRVVWDHVVVPFVLGPVPRWPAVPIIDVVWVLGAADALFPLVPRACRAAMSMESVNSDEDFDMQQLFTSRYLALKCAGRAGSARCVRWIVGTTTKASTRRHNNGRDCLTVLRGLCYGGHIGMAQELVQHRGGDAPPSSGDTTTTTTSCCWKGVPLSWPADDPDVMDEIRDATGMTTPSLLWDACRGGHVEAVKWVMSTFVGVGSEPWELVEPFHGAVRGGHSDVLKWLASNTDAVAACRTAARMERWSVGDFFQTPSLEVVKLCVGWLCGEERDPIEGEEILSSFIMHSSSSCGGKEVEEGCKWIKESFSVTTAPNLLDCINNEEALQWVIKSFNITAENDLWYLLKYSKSVKLLLWLPTLINIYNNPNTFIEEACCNPQDSVSVVEALFSAVLPRPSTLPIQQLQEFLKHSLDHGNTHISDWLENTFHVMGGVNADHSVAVSMFPKISSFGGIQWFVSHATRETLHILSESSAVTEALKNNILSGLCSSLLLLLDTFKISVPPQIRPVVVEQVVSTGNISQAKQILMFHGNFSSDEVAEGLTDSGHHVRSGKVVKWLIKKFHLDEEQVRLHDNHLLKDLLWKQKTNCAEWLIHKFNFTLDEIPAIVEQLSEAMMSLRTWKMLLRESLMDLAMSSPLHIQATVSAVEGLTMDDMVPDTDDDDTRWLTALWWLVRPPDSAAH